MTAWEKSRELWDRTNPVSTNFSFMQEQLLSGDAWIVFDHTSRLANAFNERPDDFAAFPAPAGPEGGGFADQEFMVLLGASGCGKTTLLRIICGLQTATKGEVWIVEPRVDHLAPKDRSIAMVFRNYAVFPHLTVFENIGFGLRMQKSPNDEVKRRVERVAGLMHIEMLLKQYSGELSGGQRQRVAVVRALAMEPDVVLMDEPLSNLDALLRMGMRAELKGVLAESKTTAVYVTHDQVKAMSMADRISVMYKGEIVQAASPIEVYRNPAAKFVASFIGNPPMNFLNATSTGDGNVIDGPKANKPLQFAIHPEDIEPANEGLQAMVRIVEPFDAHLLVTCDVHGAMFRAILESNMHVKPGEMLTLAPQADRVRWFDPNTTLAVA